jgi:hypothetical protein
MELGLDSEDTTINRRVTAVVASLRNYPPIPTDQPQVD